MNKYINRETWLLMRYFARRILYKTAGKIEKLITGKKKFF